MTKKSTPKADEADEQSKTQDKPGASELSDKDLDTVAGGTGKTKPLGGGDNGSSVVKPLGGDDIGW